MSVATSAPPTCAESRAAPRTPAAVCAALVAAACAAPASTGREVQAADPADAARYAAYVSELEPEIRRLLPGTWDVDLELVVEDDWGAAHPTRTGYTLVDPAGPRATIHMNRGGHPDPDGADARGTLAHELVHALIGTDWRALPPVMEEGLCTWVAERFAPPGADARAARLARFGGFLGELALPLEHVDPRSGERVRTAVYVPVEERPDPVSPQALLALCDRDAYLELHAAAGPDRAARLQEIGYLVARRVLEDRGPAGLLALCRRAVDRGLACVPAGWLLDAAGLETSVDWLAAAWATADPEAFAVWLEWLPELSAEPLAWACVELYEELRPEGGLASFWERVDPRLEFSAGRRLRLADVRGVSRRVRR